MNKIFNMKRKDFRNSGFSLGILGVTPDDVKYYFIDENAQAGNWTEITEKEFMDMFISNICIRGNDTDWYVHI